MKTNGFVYLDWEVKRIIIAQYHFVINTVLVVDKSESYSEIVLDNSFIYPALTGSNMHYILTLWREIVAY